MSSKDNQSRDDRFLKVKKDPRFWEIPEREHKIKIDKRFQSMFHDDKFKLTYTVDKRGRPINHTSSEDLKRFYNLSDSEDEDVKKEKGKKKKRVRAKTDPEKVGGKTAVNTGKPPRTEKALRTKDTDLKVEQLQRGVPIVEEDDRDQQTSVAVDDKDTELEDTMEVSSEEEEEEEEEEDDDGAEEDDEGVGPQSDVESGSEEGSDLESEDDSDSGPDLARGKGNMETSSEDEDEDEDVAAILRREEEEIEHDWGDLCKDATRNEEVSTRLAVCNMDWDRMKAKDLLALFNSFKPGGGVVLSVKIYPSEFGKERIQLEQSQGPLELMALPEDPEKDTEEERIYREKMRDYQFKRLKYFYAVVECDSHETALKIYEECDGFEYESSCSVLDLRFIPDDETFDEEPKDVATDIDLSTYTPKLFTSTAAATSKVELTWDETDHERVTALSRKFNKDELLQMDFNAYLASSSDEEGEDVGTLPEEPEEEDKLSEEKEVVKTSRGKKDAEQIAKYREMLKSIQDKEKKQNDNAMEMEITWVPGLKETTEKLVQKKLEGKDKMTPWEEFLEKKKDKKRLNKTKRKQASDEPDTSDDEIPPDVDLNDPFFAEELAAADLNNKKQAKKTKKQEMLERTPLEEEEFEKQKAEMALLMDDQDDSKQQHFNYDKIVEQQNLSKNKRKKLLKKEGTPLVEDEFQVDVKDPRFQAMFTSHLYNLDPSDPGYKKTKATQSILAEKQRRREEQQQQQDNQEDLLKTKTSSQEKKTEVFGPKEPKQKAMDPSLSMLIKSIKNKTEQFQARKKQKTT
ncbi:ESF1 homolog [Aplochiton taeniatus]